jgi:hypothetical protein
LFPAVGPVLVFMFACNELPLALSLTTTQSITAAMRGRTGTVHKHLAPPSLPGVSVCGTRINV